MQQERAERIWEVLRDMPPWLSSRLTLGEPWESFSEEERLVFRIFAKRIHRAATRRGSR